MTVSWIRTLALALGFSALTWCLSLPAAAAADYHIHPGDALSMTVFGEPTLSPSSALVVLPDGSIDVPLVGVVQVGGMTPSEAGSAVAERLRQYLRDPKVTIAVATIAPVEVLVIGDVKTPGKYVLNPPARLTDAIAAGGGLLPIDGDLPDARIETAGGAVESVSLQQLLHDGDTSLDQYLPNGSTVYIPAPDQVAIHVLGDVVHPGLVEVRKGDDVAIAVAVAGAASDPDFNHVTVTRIGADGKATTQTVDLYEILKHGDLSHDIIMQKGDLVYVPASPRHGFDAGGAGNALMLLRALVP